MKDHKQNDLHLSVIVKLFKIPSIYFKLFPSLFKIVQVISSRIRGGKDVKLYVLLRISYVIRPGYRALAHINRYLYSCKFSLL